MAVQTAPPTSDRPAGTQPLPLENGDRLSRGEFEWRHSARPDLKKAELIEGVVYMPSPVRSTSHSRPHAAILGWLVTYCASTPGVWADDNATVRLDLDNEPQPDGLLHIDPVAGGRFRQEYVVWRVLDREIDWFVLSDGEYRPLTADSDGMIESFVFPGLRLAITALLQGDTARVLTELQNGLRTPRHPAFIESLAARRFADA